MLRQRLRGPSLAAYYPRRVATFKNLRALYPNHELYDEDEEDRLEHIQIAKSRGKGAPKKKKTAAGKYRIITSTEMVGDVRGGFCEDNADHSLVQKAGRSLERRNRLTEVLWAVKRCTITACWKLACLCTDDALGGVAGAGTIPWKGRDFTSPCTPKLLQFLLQCIPLSALFLPLLQIASDLIRLLLTDVRSVVWLLDLHSVCPQCRLLWVSSNTVRLYGDMILQVQTHPKGRTAMRFHKILTCRGGLMRFLTSNQVKFMPCRYHIHIRPSQASASRHPPGLPAQHARAPQQ